MMRLRSGDEAATGRGKKDAFFRPYRDSKATRLELRLLTAEAVSYDLPSLTGLSDRCMLGG